MSLTARALFVLAFMGLLTLQTATGFLYDLLGGLRPKALTAIDGLVDTILVGPLGRTGAIIALSGLSFLTAALAYRRGVAERCALSSKAEAPVRASERQAASLPARRGVAVAPVEMTKSEASSAGWRAVNATSTRDRRGQCAGRLRGPLLVWGGLLGGRHARSG